MFQRKSMRIVLISIVVASAIILLSPCIKNLGLLFYSQYQNGNRCKWINEQHLMNSVWIEQEEKYLLLFSSESEICELKSKKDDSSIKCEFFTSDVYFYKPGKEVLNQNDKPMIAATWLYDKKSKSLLINVITTKECNLEIETGMILTFKNTGDGSLVS